MSVSYLSKPIQSSPYVAPLDLNVLAKVLSTKQLSFDQHANEVQNKIDNIAALDVMKGEDKNYINAKLNNIVDNVNKLGGVDLSDYNVSNQIGNYAGSIYSDDKIINAVASTKRARALMSSYEKMKSDPKLMKSYSEANEYADTKALKQWANDGQVGTAYNGPSSATPFQDYNKDFQDVFKTILPQQFTKLTTGNGYIEKETGKVISEKKVYEIAQGMLNPRQREQMQRDAVYLYEGKVHYGKEQLVSKALGHREDDIAEENELLQKLKGAMIAETNPNEKNKISKQISEKTDYVNRLNQARSSDIQNLSSLYDQNPSELMYKVYSNDYFNALGKRYAVNQVDKTLAGDPLFLEKMRQNGQNMRQAATNQQAVKIADAREKGAWARAVLDSQTALQVADMKKKAETIAGDPFATGNINPNLSTADEDARRLKAQQKMAETTTAMSAIKDDYIKKAIAEHPEMTPQDANTSFEMLSEAMAEKSKMTDGLIKNLPAGFGEKFEEYNAMKFAHQTFQKSAFLGQFGRPQYLTKTITPDDQNNNKDPNYRIYEAIKSDLLKDGKINDPADITFQQIYASPTEEGGFKISYFQKGKKGAILGKDALHEYDLSPEKAQALGFVEPPGILGVLNKTVDTGNDYTTYIQSEKDPNFSAKIRIYKIKDGEFGAQYIYGNNTPVNLLKGGNASMPADAYYRATTAIKNYRKGDITKNKYQTTLDFQKDLGIEHDDAPQQPEDFTKGMNLYKFK